MGEDSEQDEAKDSAEDEATDSAGDEAKDSAGDEAKGGSETVDLSDTVAPSIGPNTTFDKRPAEERLAEHDQSDVDALGLDKRRQVIGGQYSATVTRQVVTWVIAAAVIIGGAFGLKKLADDLDKPPAKVADQAPWTGSDKKPTPLQ
jgi:hypothetical protein